MYLDKQGIRHENIYLFPYGEATANPSYPCGWYFGTEDEDLVGPFGTLEEAESELTWYCKEYLT
jgi:hypothetical protein